MLKELEVLAQKTILIQRQLVSCQDAASQERHAAEVNLGDICRGILDILDLIENLIGNDPTTAPQTLRKLEKRLKALLTRSGAAEIKLSGNKIEPGLTKVVGTRPVTADTKAGEILEVCRTGYLLKGCVLRPIEVITACQSVLDR